MLLDIFAIVIEGIARWGIFSLLLWIMIKIQKFNHNIPGLLLVSGLVTLIDYIPVVGPYLAYPALVFGLYKLTRADIAPDIIFTIAITRALMFCVNLFVIGALMGNLRPDLTATARAVPEPEPPVADEPAEPPPPPKPIVAEATVRELSVKGISINPSKALAIVGYGRTCHTVTTGESFLVEAPPLTHKVRCQEITRSFVLVSIDDGEPVKLRMR